MKRVGLWMAIGIGIFISGGLLTVEPRYAEGKEQMCTVKTLKGRYLFALNSTLLPPAFGVTEPTPSSAAGFHVFNGDGTGTDVITGRVGGQIVLENVVSPISYSVNADCTGSLTVVGGPTFGLFIAPDGESLASITTDPGGTGASVHRRVSRR